MALLVRLIHATLSACVNVVLGHQFGTTRAGILQRDVSDSNILIVHEGGEGDSAIVGFLHDFDYSLMTNAAPSAAEVPLSKESLIKRIEVAYGQQELKNYTVSPTSSPLHAPNRLCDPVTGHVRIFCHPADVLL